MFNIKHAAGAKLGNIFFRQDGRGTYNRVRDEVKERKNPSIFTQIDELKF
jgi:hypothetical protein